MTCEAFVIGSVAGLALTGAFQVLTDRKGAARKTTKQEKVRRLTIDTIAA
jgi:hypothetical protein